MIPIDSDRPSPVGTPADVADIELVEVPGDHADP